MEQQFTIRNFIDNRWANAKRELSRCDPAFVAEIEVLDRAQRLGLILPNPHELPVPSHRLSSEWHDLLAITMEIVQELQSLHLTVSLMDPDNSREINRRLQVYYFDVWLQRVFNLCEKVKTLAKKSCRLLLRGSTSGNWKEHEDRCVKLIESQVQNEVEELRSPSVHGTGGRGNLSSRVITEEQRGWETLVVGGPWMIDQSLEASFADYAFLPPKQFFSTAAAKTDYVTRTLGEILIELDHEIARATQP